MLSLLNAYTVDLNSKNAMRIVKHVEGFVESLGEVKDLLSSDELNNFSSVYTDATAQLFSDNRKFDDGSISKDEVLTNLFSYLAVNINDTLNLNTSPLIIKYIKTPIAKMIKDMLKVQHDEESPFNPLETTKVNSGSSFKQTSIDTSVRVGSTVNPQPKTGNSEYSEITTGIGGNVKVKINGDSTFTYSRDGQIISEDQALDYGATIPVSLGNGKYKIGTNTMTQGKITRR